MESYQVILLLLVLQVILDASGDALRLRKRQIAHHTIESFQIAVWIFVWALFEFQAYYIVMYILGRFILFDLVFNLIAGNKIFYVGESSLYGRFFAWIVPKMKEPGHLVPWLKLLALIWWVAWFVTKGG